MYLVRTPYLLKLFYKKVIWNFDRKQPVVYLTFDDGPIPDVTPWVLDMLKQFDVKATFFCIGDNIRKYPHIYADLVKAGHSIGNHTYNHLNGWKTRKNNYISNIGACDEIISEKNLTIYNSKPVNLFRPPYGKIRPKQIKAIIQRFNYKLIMWDILSGDFDKKTSPEICLKNVLKNVKNGSVVVFHDSLKAENNLRYALPKVLQYLRDNNYKMKAII
jgi:peptidoglycan/xylan/chitin deacetylase (PgdA/CDA1 family)